MAQQYYEVTENNVEAIGLIMGGMAPQYLKEQMKKWENLGATLVVWNDPYSNIWNVVRISHEILIHHTLEDIMKEYLR